jgi:glutaredoxin
VKELLSREGASFSVQNIEEDDRAYDKLLALGFRTVPVTVIGAHIVKGFDEAALTAALAEYRNAH